MTLSQDEQAIARRGLDLCRAVLAGETEVPELSTFVDSRSAGPATRDADWWRGYAATHDTAEHP